MGTRPAPSCTVTFLHGPPVLKKTSEPVGQHTGTQHAGNCEAKEANLGAQVWCPGYKEERTCGLGTIGLWQDTTDGVSHTADLSLSVREAGKSKVAVWVRRCLVTCAHPVWVFTDRNELSRCPESEQQDKLLSSTACPLVTPTPGHCGVFAHGCMVTVLPHVHSDRKILAAQLQFGKSGKT